MLAYRIVREKYASDINMVSGFRNRWNDDGQYVLYTTGSRALACLENLVHRSALGMHHFFKTMVINVPDDLLVIGIDPDTLPANWRKTYCPECLLIGAMWYSENQSPVLKVPSSIIPEEYNYILNTRHPDFSKITLLGTEDFLFDERL
jgi:RES domain-containing protein